MNKRRGGAKRSVVLLIASCVLILLSFGANEDDLKKAAVRIVGDIFVQNSGLKVLRVLADDIGPRLSGSEAARRAVDYCQGVFRNYGLTNIHLEPFEIPGWFPGPALAEAVEPISKNLKVETLGLSINTPPQGLVSEVIDVGHGSEEDFEKWGPAIRGKIVLAGLKTPADHSKATKESQKVYYSTQKGAAACLIVSGTPGGLTRTRAAVYGDYSSIPAAFITYEDGTWLRRRLEDGKPVKIRLLIQNRLPGPILAENVVAEIKGQEKPEEIVIFGTHLDSWFLGPGAADNSLGVSIALETARVLSRPDFRLRRTVRFVLFCGEEQGSLGSFEYVKNHEGELDRIVLMVCADMTGLNFPEIINPYGACAIRDRLLALLPVLGGLGITRVEARYPYDGDDFNFVAKGIPSLGLQDRADESGHSQWSWYHSYADTFDKIEVERLNISTAAIAIIIYYAASTPDPFPKRLSQDAVITYFKEKGLVKTLKIQGTWRKLGFPEDGR